MFSLGAMSDVPIVSFAVLILIMQCQGFSRLDPRCGFMNCFIYDFFGPNNHVCRNDIDVRPKYVYILSPSSYLTGV